MAVSATVVPVVVAVITTVTSLVMFVANRQENARQEESRRTMQQELEEFKAALAKRAADESKASDALALVARYREPLLRAAYDLQSRLYNALRGPGIRGVEADYIERSTLFVIADFLGWLEIIRRDMQFLDLGAERHTRELNARVASVQDLLASTTRLADPYYLYRSEQRAIGELMLAPIAGTSARPGPRYETIGYAEFCRRLGDPEFAAWFARLTRQMPLMSASRAPRLVEVQRALIDLIDQLDPEHVRYTDYRSKLGEG